MNYSFSLDKLENEMNLLSTEIANNFKEAIQKTTNEKFKDSMIED